MKLLAAALLLTVAGAAAPPPASAPAPPPDDAALESPPAEAAPDPEAQEETEAPPARNSDYTTQMLDPPLVPEYDPATALQPAYAEAPDEDGIRQCIGPDGVPTFTDRRCADLGATAIPPPGTAFGGNLGRSFRMHSCARNQDALLAGVRAALENHDANRLADYYHWSGMGSTEAYRLMDRLGTFSARPVVDVQLVRGAPADPYSDSLWFDTPPPPLPDEPESDSADPGMPDGAAPPPRRRPHASMLRVDQMRGEHDAASTVTYFHLLTNAGCWWMRF